MQGSSHSHVLDCILELPVFPTDNLGHMQEATVESPKKGSTVRLQNETSSG